MTTTIRRLGICLLFCVCLIGNAALAAEYYLDGEKGDDAQTGTSPEAAWRSLDKLNQAALQPGDTVFFKTGGLWYGSIKPRSGAEGKPVTYTAYGDAALGKPRIYGSSPLHRKAADWEKAGDDLWQTRADNVTRLPRKPPFIKGPASLHHEGNAVLTWKDAALTIESSGDRTNFIQWIFAPFPIEAGKCYEFTLTFKNNAPEALSADRFRLMAAKAPYNTYGKTVGSAREGSVVRMRFQADRTADDARLTLFLGGDRSLDRTTLAFARPPEWSEVTIDSLGLSVDVGNLIFDGEKAGWKRWSREELKNQGDFYYDPDRQCVVLRSAKPPTEQYKTIEAALKRHIVDMTGTSWCVFDGLDLRYGAAHGFGGTRTAHYVIRDCDLSWIGGALQHFRDDGRPVRYGNAIEFWSSARDHLVESNRIWEIYDAALTNQGSGKNEQRDIVYRNNEIWNSEYSFEYWNRDAESVTDGILFEGNVCRDAGFGWGHVQRPDRNGRHLMFYHNTAKTSGVRIVRNTFSGTTHSMLRIENQWNEPPGTAAARTPGPIKGLAFEGNVFQPDGDKPFAFWLFKNYTQDEFFKAVAAE